MEGQRVVITGLGMVTPLGNDTASSWAAALAGRSGLGWVSLCDASRLPPTVVGEVRGFDGDELVGRREARKMERHSLLAVAAAREAWADSGATIDDPLRTGVVVGNAVGGYALIQEQAILLAERGPMRVSPHMIGAMLADTPTFHIAAELGARGTNFATVSACASGAQAVGEAAEVIRRGDADAMLAGGVEACISELILGGFHVMRALGSPRDGEGLESASRPFDATRDGFVIGEGAAMLVLEREDRARARGAHIYAEVASYAGSNDAHHIAAPHPEGIGVIGMMRHALERAGIGLEEVGYVNAHGTSTPLNDRAETAAIKRRLRGRTRTKLAVSSTKSMTGHLLGAAGAFETAVCALAIEHGVVPPTINHVERDAECDLDYVTEGARALRVDVALSNSMGLGGHNACTVVRRVG